MCPKNFPTKSPKSTKNFCLMNTHLESIGLDYGASNIDTNSQKKSCIRFLKSRNLLQLLR